MDSIVCSGSSQFLPAAECASWVSFYDATNGLDWTTCKDNRLDPCSCGGDASAYGVTCTNNHIVKLNLYSQNLVGPFPASISGLANLEYMDVSLNKLIGTIPSTVSDLARLGYINFHANELSGLLPALPFSQYSGGCFLQQLNFSCPLPPDSDLCTVGAPTCAGTLCTGSYKSQSLPAAECASWVSFYDATNGLDWTTCKDNRLDPCSCGGDASAYGVTCTNNHIVKLNLYSQNLVGPFPASISGLANLEYMDVSLNKLIGTIPSTVSDLARLGYINFHANELSGLLPALPFSQYSGGCYFSTYGQGNTNHFQCPLPPDSDQCKGSPPTCVPVVAAIQ